MKGILHLYWVVSKFGLLRNTNNDRRLIGGGEGTSVDLHSPFCRTLDSSYPLPQLNNCYSSFPDHHFLLHRFDKEGCSF